MSENPGRSLERDPKTGRITGATLSSEEASRMGKRKHKLERSRNAQELLEELGWNNENPAPPSAIKFAEKVAAADSGMVSAWKELRRLAGLDLDAPPGSTRDGTCPACGFNPADLSMPSSFALEMMKELREYTEAENGETTGA